MRVWYRDCALAFQAKEVSLSLTIRSTASVSPFATNEDKGNWKENTGSNPVWGSIFNKGINMNIKTFMAAAVIALTAACTPTEDTASVAAEAGPAADEALAAAEAAEAPAEAAEPALGENEQPK